MKVQPYLFMDGRCEEALEFYRSAIGAEIEFLMRIKESPEPCKVPPGNEDKVLHAAFRVGGTTLFASDGFCQSKPTFQGFSLSLETADVAEAERLFAALGEGGQVNMPLGKTFFSPAFGMLTDRFGVPWMVIAAG